MKWLIVVINLIVLVSNIAAIARQEKIIKKPHGLKPTKPSKTIIDEFRHLSSEDLEFLKQVDKQYKVHGDKIKIKVERENSTAVVNKNSKRTIDGSLGYGYHQNQQQRGYYFSQPHLMHQFTAQDVSSDKGEYREKATDIEVQQSHSFEIKDPQYTANYQSAGSHNYQQEQVYEDPVPVIVLRIPGPQKYALHLQALLQQYLEIRAAQYIKALEEQERHGHLMHPQHYVAQQHQHMQYVPMIVPMYNHQYYQQPQQQQQQPDYQHYYQHQVHHGSSYQIPAGEQSYYNHQPQQQAPQEYQQVQQQPQEYPTSYINFVTPTYEQGELHHKTQHHQHHQHQQNEDVSLETSENYPSDKHTQVIFKKKKNRAHRPAATYITSEPIVVPDPPMHHQQEETYQHQPETVHYNHQPEHGSYDQKNGHNEYPAEAEIVAVTQRTKSPYNYHVNHPTLAPTHEELHERHNPKRMAPFTKEQFEKARRMTMNKSKRNRGSVRPEKMMVKSMSSSIMKSMPPSS